jgi:hypothetical protein
MPGFLTTPDDPENVDDQALPNYPTYPNIAGYPDYPGYPTIRSIRLTQAIRHFQLLRVPRFKSHLTDLSQSRPPTM